MSFSAEQNEADAQRRFAGLIYRRSTLWLVLALITLAVLIGHQTLGVIDRDEARFAQASKQMLASGDFITPYFMDELRAKKPIAIYWLQSASAALFGTTDIASYRMPSLAGLILSLRIWGLPATLANAVMLGSLFGLQKMRLCMVQLLFVNLLNIVLNFGFVLGLSWQVEGVALASVCAEWAGLMLMIGVVLRPGQPLQRVIRTLHFDQLFSKDRWAGMLAIARDLSLRTLLIWAVEAILLAKAATLGDGELASLQIMLVLFGFIAFGLDGFAHATEALTGQFIGAANQDGLRLIIRRSCVLAGAAALIITGCLYVLEPVLLPLLTSQAALLQMTSDIWIWGLAMPVAAFLAFQMDGVYVGAASSHHMRNGMILAFGVFAALVSLFERYHLDGLLFVFILYLIIRGVYLAAVLPSVLRLARPEQFR